MGANAKSAEGQRTFLTRLARDRRGNTMALMGMAMIPLAGMVGGGIDVARMYMLKTRLQHACDAGALAGRRTMGGGTWTYNNSYAKTQANLFFDGNFKYDSATKLGAYGSSEVARDFSENAGTVTGTSSAKIPMTVMKIFKMPDQVISVTCDAAMRLPNTDVMFVLDTTGSMDEIQPGDTVTKLSALKTSVKCFYEIVARLNTDANCVNGTPSGGTGNQVQIRFGFVPFATNVNVGKLLNPAWFADTWNYQTRTANYTTQNNGYTWVQQGQPQTSQNNGSLQTSQSNCTQANADAYNSSDPDSYSNNNNTKTTTSYTYTLRNPSYTNGNCNYTVTKTVTTYSKQPTTQQVFSSWRYAQLPVNVSLLKNGTTWNDSFQWPIGSNGSNRTIPWAGCIEERRTTTHSSYDPIPNDDNDLDIDSVPTSDPNTKWGMALPALFYGRGATSNNNQSSWTQAEKNNVTGDYSQDFSYACPPEAKKLQTWSDPTVFDNYVNQFVSSGNTYHDIGLLWGARLMSPTGLFADENRYTSQGGEIDRHMIFMTDGDACTNGDNYTAYGVNWFDRRTIGQGTTPSFTQNCTSGAPVTDQVNARTEALCSAIKNKNITLWVIAFGNLATSTETRLQNCATSGRYFKATNASELQTSFRQIADQISMLRLTN